MCGQIYLWEDYSKLKHRYELLLSIIKRIIKVYQVIEFKYRNIIYLSFLTSLLLSLSEAIFLGSIYSLVSSLIGDTSLEYKNLSKLISLDETNDYIILCGILVIALLLLKISNIFFNTFLYYKINTSVSNNIFYKILFQRLDFHKNTNSANLISVINVKSQSVGEITFFLMNIMRALLILSTITTVTIYISSKEFLLVFVVFLILFLSIYFIFKKNLKILGVTIAKSNDETIKNLQEGLSSIIFILLYKSQNSITNKFKKIITNLRKSQAKVVFLSSVPYIFIQSFSFLFILYLIYFFDLNKNFINLIPLITMWFLAIQRLIPSFNEIFSALSTIKSLSKNFSDTENLINLKIQNKGNSLSNRFEFNDFIKFDQINFGYETNKLVLKNLNFIIYKGSIFGISGKTGVGKSTLINLLAGFYRPLSGDITIDDRLLKDSDIPFWQNNISYVPQKVYLYDDTLATNITFETSNEKIDFNLLDKAIAFAELKDFVKSQDLGIRYIIGENAERISGGQKQRIGIARAIYKDTDIIILDEALNSLDIKTKNLILNKLKKLKKTIIVISHEKSDFDICDKVLEI